MAKRFTDTELWDKEWFMSLEPRLKCLVKYVRDKADLAGIWNPNYKLASLYIGEQVTEKDLISINEGKQFEKLKNGNIYCIDFTTFQYGPTLNPASPVHRKVISILEKNNVIKQEDDLKQIEKVEKFVKPTESEIIEYFETKVEGLEAVSQAQKFFNYYESVGWKVGNKKMKSWKATANNWVAKNKERTTTKSFDITKLEKELESIGNKKFSDL
jgi:hypothetical protein